MTTPSTGTSSGSLLTKEPAASRQKLEHAAAASSVPGPQRSTAGLLVEARLLREAQDDQSDTGGGGPVVPGYSSSGATEPDKKLAENDSSEPEEVGSDSSGSWHPRPREETLQGPSLNDFLANKDNKGSGFSSSGSLVPGHRTAAAKPTSGKPVEGEAKVDDAARSPRGSSSTAAAKEEETKDDDTAFLATQLGAAAGSDVSLDSCKPGEKVDDSPGVAPHGGPEFLGVSVDDSSVGNVDIPSSSPSSSPDPLGFSTLFSSVNPKVLSPLEATAPQSQRAVGNCTDPQPPLRLALRARRAEPKPVKPPAGWVACGFGW